VHLLEADPNLGRALDAAEFEHARRRLIARVETIPAGTRLGSWGRAEASQLFGLMIVSGLLLRQLAIGRSRSAELLGFPDIIRPWDHDGGLSLPIEAEVRWEALGPSSVAILDGAFLQRAAAWPSVLAALGGYAVMRAQSLAVHQAIANLNRIEDRLILLFWHLADRWGRVSREGVVLELPLTHDLLAQLAGAQRPSVTTALGQLRARGLVERRADRTWLLDPDAIPDTGAWLARPEEAC
jgi:CRP/FNR family cyclic AMP-dependent transcriptional regulator